MSNGNRITTEYEGNRTIFICRLLCNFYMKKTKYLYIIKIIYIYKDVNLYTSIWII